MKQTPNYKTPITFTGIKITSPKVKAVGVPAIYSAFKHMLKYMKTRDAIRLSLAMNQKDGFDCPGCAWPDPDDDRSSLGEYCENGIKAIAEEASEKAIGPEFFSKYSVNELATWSDFELGKAGRLKSPMILRKGSSHYTPISWQTAFSVISGELNKLDSPDEALFYTSGRTSNEAAYLYQLFVRSYGTNNLPDCSNMCHESSGVALSETVGIGKGSVTLQDLHKAELILVMGQNPGTNHPRMLSALETCKENGGKIITINPLPEAGLMQYINPQSPYKILSNGISLTDLFLPVKVNGDVAFLKAVMIKLLEKEDETPGSVFDSDFIRGYTNGYNALIAHLRNEDLNECITDSGLPEDAIQVAADMIAESKRIIICWAMGLTQHENGVENIRELVNLLLLKGAIGKEGAGTCPVRGHSNVQGDRTMGIWEAPKEAFLSKLDEVHNMISPRKHGLAVVPAIHAMSEGKAKVFFAMGGNFLSASPDTNFTGKALQKCRLTAHVSTKLNRSHLVTGETAIILPCLGRTDIDEQPGGTQFVSCENSMGIVHKSQGILKPPSSDLKSEVWIIAELAKATLSTSTVNWDLMAADYDHIRHAISKVIPGFEDYNERVREPGGFYLPNGARDREFNTDSGKAEFTINPLPKLPISADEYIMMTIRSHDQFNTTIYGLDDRYRGIFHERRIVMMNKTDMDERGFKNKEVVNLTSTFNGTSRKAENFLVVEYPIPPGNVATYFPEANALVPIDSFARKSLTPCSKRVAIRIQKAVEEAIPA